MAVAFIPSLLVIATLALASSAVSVTVTKAKIFAGLRELIGTKNAWLGELVSCPYCFSHWLAFAATAIYRPVLVDSGFWPLDLAVTAMVMVALAAFSSGLIIRAFQSPPVRVVRKREDAS